MYTNTQTYPYLPPSADGSDAVHSSESTSLRVLPVAELRNPHDDVFLPHLSMHLARKAHSAPVHQLLEVRMCVHVGRERGEGHVKMSLWCDWLMQHLPVFVCVIF